MCRRVTRFAATLVWGPGAGVEAAGGLCLSRNETGVACRPSTPFDCLEREREHNSEGQVHSLGFREDEMAHSGSESGNYEATKATERCSGDGCHATDLAAWGRRTAPRGFWIRPEFQGFCCHPKLQGSHPDLSDAGTLRARSGSSRNVERPQSDSGPAR